MTLRNHYTKTLSASPKYEAMECLIFPGNRFSYNTESVPNEIIFIVIQFGGKWIEYFYESFIATAVFFAIFFDRIFAWWTGFEKSEEFLN